MEAQRIAMSVRRAERSRLSQCCESLPEENGAGNLHATFCGNQRRNCLVSR